MVKSMRDARKAAAAGPPTDLPNLFDGAVLRELIAQVYFSFNTSAGLCSSADGFQA